MRDGTTAWQGWRRFFERRSNRPLPRLAVGEEYAGLPPSVARSLAIFQLGESGGGRIVAEARQSDLVTIDRDYAAALALLVEEERRHANLLAMCVRLLRGRLLRRHWTARLFVALRRVMGLRFKVLVLLVAEIVGRCYYRLLAVRLPGGQIRCMLEEIAADERAHLRFHSRFLRSQTRSAWQRLTFVATWRITMVAAAALFVVDHRTALRDLGLRRTHVWRRLMALGGLVERLVVGDSRPVSEARRQAAGLLALSRKRCVLPRTCSSNTPRLMSSL